MRNSQHSLQELTAQPWGVWAGDGGLDLWAAARGGENSFADRLCLAEPQVGHTLSCTSWGGREGNCAPLLCSQSIPRLCLLTAGALQTRSASPVLVCSLSGFPITSLQVLSKVFKVNPPAHNHQRKPCFSKALPYAC